MSCFEETNTLPSGETKLVDQHEKNQNQWFSSCFGSTTTDSSEYSTSLNSPVESELGCSTESESDLDDDYVAELTRRMAHYMLQDDDNKQQETNWDFAGSPQSKLTIEGKFENLKTNEDGMLKSHNNSQIFLNPSFKPTSASDAAVRTPDGSSLDFHSKQALIDEQIRAIQLCKLKQQQIIKQQEESQYWGRQSNGYKQIDPKQQIRKFQSKGRAFNVQKMSRPILLQQQQQLGNGSEMRAVFLGEPGSRNGSSGTGVFLPRGIGNSSASPKKQGCSTVFIPARVVHALKLHFDKIGAESRPNASIHFPFRNALMEDVRNGLQLQSNTTVPATNHHQDIDLPHEWTY